MCLLCRLSPFGLALCTLAIVSQRVITRLTLTRISLSLSLGPYLTTSVPKGNNDGVSKPAWFVAVGGLAVSWLSGGGRKSEIVRPGGR